MVYNAGLGAFPFVQAEPDQDGQADNKGAQRYGRGPRILTTADAETCEEQTQSRGEEQAPEEVDLPDLLPEGQMVEASMSSGRPVTDEEKQRCGAPDGALNPL